MTSPLLRPKLLSSVVFSLGLITSTVARADTLIDIYELALQNDASLKAAEATYKANLETENQAFGALLPQINGSYTISNTDSESSSETFNTNALPPTLVSVDTDADTDRDGYEISLTQKLFDLSSWFTFKSGKQLSTAAEAQFAADQQDLIIRVSQAYFNVLRAEENLQASKAEESASKRQLEQTQQRFDVGLIAITDVHEARANYDRTVVQRLSDEGDVGTAYEALSVLTGQPHGNLWILSDKFAVVNPDPMSRNDWVDFALKNNYALKAAIARAEASRLAAKASKMNHMPTITGSFTIDDYDTDGDSDINYAGNQFTTPNDGNQQNETLAITLRVPIFSGGQISASRRQAYQQYNAAYQTSLNTQRTIIQATRSLHLTVATDVQRVKARAQSIVSTRSALEATQAGYDVGTRNIVDVLDARRNLYAAIRDYANSRFDYVLNMLRLKQQAGILTPQDIRDLSQSLETPKPATASDQG